jgi:hypothetical protein
MTRERMCSKRGGSGCIYLVLYVLVLYCMLLPQARCSGSLTETWARPIGARQAQAAPPAAGQQQLAQAGIESIRWPKKGNTHVMRVKLVVVVW